MSNLSIEQFNERLAEQAAAIPEVEQSQPLIRKAGELLLSNPSYALEPSLFEEPARSLMFSAIAQRAIPVASKRVAAKRGALEHVMVAILAAEYSPRLAAYQAEVDLGDHELPDASAELIYDRYTNQTVTTRLQAAIDRGLLDNCKAELGVTPANEDPYKLRVLKVDPRNLKYDTRYYPSPLTPYDALPCEKSARDEILTAQDNAQRQYRVYASHLPRDADAMAKELGMKELPAHAWTETGEDGLQTLFLSEPIATNILRELGNGGEPSEDLKILLHEYAHTQGGIRITASGVGTNNEEIRANQFSLKGGGYEITEKLFTDIHRFTGFSIHDLIAAETKGGTPELHYVAVANALGLQGMLETSFILPQNYLASAGAYHKIVADQLGGYSGALYRIAHQHATGRIV